MQHLPANTTPTSAGQDLGLSLANQIRTCPASSKYAHRLGQLFWVDSTYLAAALTSTLLTLTRDELGLCLERQLRTTTQPPLK